MINSSMHYAIDRALHRAHGKGTTVQIQVDGDSIDGSVVAIDNNGVLLEVNGLEYWLLKLDRISAVRMLASERVGAPFSQGTRASRPMAAA